MRNVALPQTHFHQAVAELILTSHSARKRPISTPNVEAKRRSSSADGKFFVLKKQLDAGKWQDALATANALQPTDFDDAPGLLYLAGGAHLAQAVPEELITLVLWTFPPKSLDRHRDEACRERSRGEYVIKALIGCDQRRLCRHRNKKEKEAE